MNLTKKITAITAVSALLLSSVASAATVLVNEGKVNTRTEALATNQSRLIEYQDGWRPTWPGTHSGDHYAGVTAPLAYAGAYSIEKVFGPECDELLYTDLASVYSVDQMLMDTQKDLTTYDICQWNGYIFALCGGNKVKYYEDRSEYFQYGNGATITYDGCERNDTSGTDSFLYIFDVSRGANYSEALVAKWELNDLGITDLSYAPNQRMCGINVDDDYIYLTLTNGGIPNVSGNTVADQNDKLLAVFKNNISRENPDYIAGTDILRTPERAENPETVASYKYGAKVIYDYSEGGENGYFDSAIIGGDYVMWYNTNRSLNADTSKIDSFFHVTDLGKDGNYVVVNDTKIHYGQSKNLELDNASQVPFTSIIQYDMNTAWSTVIEPYINGIVSDGNLMYILISYGEGDGGNLRYYHRLYVTDWSNPQRPANIGFYQWEAEEYTEAVVNGNKAGNADLLYYYDGYFYVSGEYGITVLKLRDDAGNINVNKLSYIPYSKETTGITDKCQLVAVGNYMVLWSLDGLYPYTNNWGSESKIRLTADKTAVEELASYGIRFRRHPNIFGNSCMIYGNRIYVPAEKAQTGFVRTGMVEVINFEKAAPLEISVERVGEYVTLPYTIKGKSFGLNAVLINVNGEEAYIPTTAGEGNYKVWEYEITEPGDYEVTVTGAVLKGFPNEKTAESFSFKAVAGGEAEFGANYIEDVQEDYSVNLSVTPYLRNNQFTSNTKATPAIAIYSDGVLVKMVKGKQVTVKAGENVTFDEILAVVPSEIVEYSVKLFLLGGEDGDMPLTSAVDLKTN